MYIDKLGLGVMEILEEDFCNPFPEFLDLTSGNINKPLLTERLYFFYADVPSYQLRDITDTIALATRIFCMRSNFINLTHRCIYCLCFKSVCKCDASDPFNTIHQVHRTICPLGCNDYRTCQHFLVWLSDRAYVYNLTGKKVAVYLPKKWHGIDTPEVIFTDYT